MIASLAGLLSRWTENRGGLLYFRNWKSTSTRFTEIHSWAQARRREDRVEKQEKPQLKITVLAESVFL